MRQHRFEILAAAAVLAALAAAVALPLHVEGERRARRAVEMPTIELTGLMAQGIWTDEPVTAATSWRRDFRPARPVLRSGETVRLRLASADVVHSFSVPELGIGPVEVYPGKVVELLVTARRPGVFEYYCTTVCGEAHFAMRGFLEVREPGGSAPAAPPRRAGGGYWLAAEPPPGAGRAARGAWLFRRQGCVTCHGEAGAGGVPNPNSMNATVPALDDLARRTFLFTPADAGAFAALLADGPPLESVGDAAAVPLFPTVKSQYLATRRLVREGRRSARLAADGPRPPLDMPAWGGRLSDDEIDSILLYLLTDGGEEDRDDADPARRTRPKGKNR